MTISQAIALLHNLRANNQPTHVAVLGGASSGAPTNGLHAAPFVATQPRYSLVEFQATLQDDLIGFDERSARRHIAQALAVHTVEDVCVELLAPVLKTIGQMWANGEANVVTEHFATNVVRSQLESIFRSAGEPERGPMILLGCAPGELHEIGALMLAVFLRRAGLRTAYLGQSVEAVSLLQSIRALRPAAVVLVAVLAESARALVELAERIAGLREQGLVFGFGGPAFEAAPELAPTVPGLFLDADLARATSELRATVGT
jgi:methanogenic corrinoid protein MtbC1